ncbi:MAG: putative ribosome biogenesis GTPase RsgA [Anaerolineae bacterium]|nr:putative ribosome biogenesis GTPase RsgA [Anaerolineae bacterium]
MNHPLEKLGWNPHFAREFEPHRQAGLAAARVTVEQRGQYVVLTGAGEFYAEVTGRLLFNADSPADLPKVGDWVAVSLFEGEQKAIIHHVLPRQSRFSRQVAGGKVEEQVMAANIDAIFVVQSADYNFNLRRLERYLLLVHEGGARPLILLNKIDLCPDLPAKQAQVAAVAPGVPLVAVSAATGEGLAELRNLLRPGETYALVGSSGVGKSTLLNQLAGAELLKTGAVREGDSKGRHTTTHRELVVLPNGALLIDSPGMRELQLWSTADGLEDAFAEITALAVDCRFPDCTHTREKGCAVLAALAAGKLDRERYDSYLKLNRETDYLERKQNQKAYLDARRNEKKLGRAMKNYHKLHNNKR